jgi:hypothetical protein
VVGRRSFSDRSRNVVWFSSHVAQLFSLIWLTIVKRAIGRLSEISIYFRFTSPGTNLSQQQGRHDCGFNAEIRESTRPAGRYEVINRSRSEAAPISV